MRRGRKVIITFVILAFIAWIVQVGFSAAYSTEGIMLDQMQSEEQLVIKENLILSEKLYKQISLTTIASQAKQLGFEEQAKNSALVIGAPVPVAFNQ